MLVGFVHGVMNTDNMTISGETIDYGPCAFMDAYDPATVFSSIDAGGRYAYGEPAGGRGVEPRPARRDIAAALPRRSRPGASPSRQESLDGFRRQYAPHGRPACGRSSACRDIDDARRDAVDRELLEHLQQSRVDHTSFYRLLGRAARGDVEPVRGLFVDLAAFDGWLARWQALTPDADAMDRVNPVYIPRNHLVEAALASATEGDLDPLSQLLVGRDGAL